MQLRKKQRSGMVAMGTSILLIVAMMLICVSGVYADSYQALYPCLIDLPGWEGKEPKGVKMEMPGMNMINATREYRQGDKKINAMVVVGNPAMASAAVPQGMMNMETDEMKIAMTTIQGFKVHTVYNKKEHSGAVTVILLPGQAGGGAIFTFSFEGLTETEAMNLAQTYDWKTIQTKVQSF
ncbi:MAG: hypothetical protein JXC33_02325 [Deltaproteobacteria bacterium]|nr:hypothetical protein [Deltaproteobacteria bacterium]